MERALKSEQQTFVWGTRHLGLRLGVPVGRGRGRGAARESGGDPIEVWVSGTVTFLLQSED